MMLKAALALVLVVGATPAFAQMNSGDAMMADDKMAPMKPMTKAEKAMMAKCAKMTPAAAKKNAKCAKLAAMQPASAM